MSTESSFVPAEPRRTQRSRASAELSGRSAATTEPESRSTTADSTVTVDAPVEFVEPVEVDATTDATVDSPPSDASPTPSPRNGVRIGVPSTRRAFATGDRTTGVRAVQDALVARGYDVGPLDAVAGPRTRRAFARFLADVGLDVAVGPSRRALDLLGFDVVGADRD